MNAIDELIHEHEAVRLTLNILEEIKKEVDTKASIPEPRHLEQLFEFFSVFVDKCHHGKEEDLLFPALEAVGVSREGGPVGVMLKEHQHGRDLVAGMKAAMARYHNGDALALEEFSRQAADYITLLNYHIDKENEVLFPLAKKHFSEEKLADLQDGFDRIESERIGAGKHEAFHRMLDALVSVYLK